MFPYPSPVLSATASGATLPDANTLFLCHFNTATPKNEVGNVNGSLNGSASCDTGNSQLVVSGGGSSYAQWNGVATTFDPTLGGFGTFELHTNLAAGQVGGLISRTSGGPTRYALYCSGTGDLAFYADNFSAGTPVVHANCLDGNWHHIAIVRNGGGGGWIMFVDGVSVATNAWASGPTSDAVDNFYVGDDIASLATRNVSGRIARVKLSNVARWTAGFTPPSQTAL